MYVWPRVCLSTRMSVHVYVCPCVCLSTRMSVYVYVCPHVCLSTRMSVHAYVCPCVCLSTRMSVHTYVCPHATRQKLNRWWVLIKLAGIFRTWLKSTRRRISGVTRWISTCKRVAFLISEVKGGAGFVMRTIPNLFYTQHARVTEYSRELEERSK